MGRVHNSGLLKLVHNSGQQSVRTWPKRLAAVTSNVCLICCFLHYVPTVSVNYEQWGELLPPVPGPCLLCEDLGSRCQLPDTTCCTNTHNRYPPTQLCSPAAETLRLRAFIVLTVNPQPRLLWCTHMVQTGKHGSFISRWDATWQKWCM